jgi:hypothetical protein
VTDQLTAQPSIFTDAMLNALFAANNAPTEQEVNEGIRDAKTYGEVANRLIANVGIVPRLYAKDQPVFGPLVRLLSLAGWTHSGSGYFSVAFFKGGLALKLSLRASDDAARDYLHWCKSNDHRKGVPLLHAMGEFDHSYVVLMDRYTPLTGETDASSVLYDPHVAAEYEDVQTAIYTGIRGSFPTSITAAEIHCEFEGRARFDIHSGNVMLDRNGGIVITDPLGRSVIGEHPYSYESYSYDYDNGYAYSQAA